MPAAIETKPPAAAGASPPLLERVRAALQSAVGDGRVARPGLLEGLLDGAVRLRASDIHFDPTPEALAVRFRIDGVFQELDTIPKALHEQVIARAKVMADLISHKRDIVQEGRIPFALDGQPIDFRLSIVPTVAGERMVIRVFDPVRMTFEIRDLGFESGVLGEYERRLFDLHGMLVFTGPSGSGKTTTMYTSLKTLRGRKAQFVSVVTLEDPVEYEMGLFPQIQVNRARGLDFAAGLSAVLRQDPEVIMVGEIRDAETCEVALRAGLTGHLVLTTIHSGTSCGVVTRILEMGIEPFIAASSITGIVAQRLVRQICERCRTEAAVPGWAAEYFAAAGGLPPRISAGRGCERCQGSGYLGRSGIFEFLAVDDRIRALILRKATVRDLLEGAKAQGMRTLLDAGAEKVRRGLTTPEEIVRVIGSAG